MKTTTTKFIFPIFLIFLRLIYFRIKTYRIEGVIKIAENYRFIGEYEKSIESYERAVKLTPDDDALYDNIGFSYMQMEVFEKAISYYEKSLDLNPDNFESWNNLGTLYNHKNEFKKAEECYKEAMKWKEKSLI